MSYPPQGSGGSGDATLANQTTLLTRLSAARAGYMDELAAANLPTDVGNLLSRLTSTRAGYMDALNRQRPDMIFPSAPNAAESPIVALPAVAADLDFPSVVVSGLPSGLSIAKADFVLVCGALFDTSGAENQVDQASKTIRVKVSTGSWGSDDIVALTFGNLSLQTDADAYRGGVVLYGSADIKSVISGDGTYNFRSEETNRSEGVTVTGASLEMLDAFSVVRVWFN